MKILFFVKNVIKVNRYHVFTYLYASSDTLILPGSPVVSVRLVKLTVLPKRQ